MAAWESPGFVAVVVGPDGKPIREIAEDGKRTVRLPFGSEYKLRLKNKTRARAYVRIEIDGMDALSGKKLVMPADCTKDIERFLEGDNSKGAKYKFVEAGNSAVTDPTSGENGRIRIIFEPESVPVVTTTLTTSGADFTTKGVPFAGGGILRGMGMGSTIGASYNSSGGVTNAAYHVGTPTSSNNFHMDVESLKADAGATVGGAMSGQQFQDTNEWFPTLAPVTIDLWMKGPKVEAPRPFTVYSYPGQPVIINGVAFPGCTSCISADYVSVTVPRHLVNLQP